MGLKNFFRGNPLKAVSLGGLVLGLVLIGALVFFSLTRDLDLFPQRSETSFSRDLRSYDAALGVERPELLDRRLDGLERRAKAQEEWLSVLKRRRNLSQTDSRFLPHYQKSAQDALRKFPYSEAMAAVAGDSVIQDPLFSEKTELLRSYAGRMSQLRFVPVALSLYVLSGALESPYQAASIPGIDKLLAADLSQDLSELLMIDEILLGILRGETHEISVKINELLRVYPQSRDLLVLGGEFFYDYDNPLRAAELFTRMGDSYFGRAADAQVMAGEIAGARNIWMALGSSPGSDQPELQARSLYNLASTAANEREAASWLERIYASPGNAGEILGVFGIILYSRLQTSNRAIAFLDEHKDNPLVDLEILRRRMETLPVDRSTAEVWLLLGHNPEAEDLFQWGAWYFDRQKLYVETTQLMKIAAQRRFSAPWLDLCRSLTLLREGRIDEGLKILEEEHKKNPSGDWRFPANIARVHESRRSVTAALSYYEVSAELSKNPQDSSLIQLRISRCLDALGRYEESRQALTYALQLDPDNLEAASLLRRQNRPIIR